MVNFWLPEKQSCVNLKLCHELLEMQYQKKMLDAKIMKINSRKVLNDFCESTSLHGYSYWYSADSLILKVAWTFVILAATILGVVFLGNQTREYLDGTILTTIETSSAPLDVSIFKDPI